MAKVIEISGVGNVEFPDGMGDEQIAAAIKKNYPSERSFGRAVLEAPTDVLKGMGSEVQTVGQGIYGLARKAVPSLPELPEWLRKAAEPPESIAGKAGKFGTELAEFAIPAARVGKAAAAVKAATAVPETASLTAKAISKFAPALTRAGGEAATAGGVEAIRSGGDIGRTETAAELGGGLALGASALAPGGKFVVRGVTDLLGKMTGAGGEAVRTAATTATQEFKDAMRNRVTEIKIVKDLGNAVAKVREARGQAYRQAFNQLDQGIELSLHESNSALISGLQGYRVNVVKGKLNWADSPIVDKTDRGLFQDAVNDIQRQRDLTPAGVDALKQRIYAYGEQASPKAQAFFWKLGDSLRKNLDTNVPGYKELTQDYAEASDLLKQVSKELSADAENPGTIIRKLTYALNQNNSYRKLVLEMLDESAGSHMKETMAGYALKEPLARGLAGVGQGIAGWYQPAVLARSLLFGSPRAVGETMALIGALGRKTPSAIKAAPLTPLGPAAAGFTIPPAPQ